MTKARAIDKSQLKNVQEWRLWDYSGLNRLKYEQVVAVKKND